jgi:hypothetical protein
MVLRASTFGAGYDLAQLGHTGQRGAVATIYGVAGTTSRKAIRKAGALADDGEHTVADVFEDRRG